MSVASECAAHVLVQPICCMPRKEDSSQLSELVEHVRFVCLHPQVL
jgi:hypothetical protein